jgi:hypothetical protein
MSRRIGAGLFAIAIACAGDDGSQEGDEDSSGAPATTHDGGTASDTAVDTAADSTTEAVDTGGSSSSTGGGAEQHPAVIAFWSAFLAEEYASLPDVIADLDAAATENPDDAEVVLIRAHAHLWRLGEFERDPDQGLAVQIESSMAAIESFTAAKALAPDDYRIPCWLGLALINTGTALGDDEMIAQGRAEVDASVEGFPEFSLFCRMLEYENAPYDSPEFQETVDAVWDTLDLCFGEMVDRDAPDLSPYLDQQTAEGNKRVCWNLTPKAVHNWQGFMIHAGDIIAKSGAVDAATVLYEDAELLDWETWQHQDLIDDRLADVAGRAASYQDGDPMNDAEIGSGTYSCTMCHGG